MHSAVHVMLKKNAIIFKYISVLPEYLSQQPQPH